MKVDYFRNITDFETYPAGAVIFEEGTPGACMYVVREGQVAAYRGDRLLEVIEPDHFVGEMALIDTSPRAARAVAHTDCKLIRVDQRRFLFLVQETPTFALQVMHELAERLRRWTRLVDTL